ncbi:MAG: PAS domain S-box protein [Bacteroidia bacterium]|nr:PAS domain S-box protein [Bacteroidia bacterium]
MRQSTDLTQPFFILLLSDNAQLSGLISKVSGELRLPVILDRSNYLELFELPLEYNEVNMVLVDLDKRLQDAEVLYRQIRELNVQVPIIFLASQQEQINFDYLTADSNVNIMFREDLSEGVVKYLLRGLRQIRKAMDAKIYAQTELAESESLLKQSQQLAKLGHFRFNFLTRKDIWSEETYRIYGIDPRRELASEELFYSLIHPDDYQYFMEETAKFLSQGQPYHLDYRLRLRDGTIKYVENYTRPYFDGHGNLESCTGSVQDITEKKIAELELKKSQDRLYRILENLPSGAVFVEGGRLTLNRAAERITGYERNELQTLDDWFEKLYGKNHDVVKMIYENDRNKSFPSSQITPITRKDGKQVEMEFAGVELGGTEVWLLNDLSNVKSQQELFKGLFEHSSDGMLLLEESKIVDCNQQAVKLLKAKNKNYIVGKEPIDLCHESQPNGKTLEEKREEVNAMVAGNNTVVTEWNHKTSDGQKLPVRVTITKVNIRNKSYRLVVWHDLSEHYELKRKEENKDRFIKKLVSYQHDLITVLDVDTLSIIYSNDQVEELLGYTNQELIQMGGSFWTNMVEQEDLSQIEHMVESFPNLKKDEAIQVFIRAKHKNGSRVFLHIKFTIFSLDITGRPSQVIGSARAIPKELFKAHQNVAKDQKVTSILDTLPDALFVYDLESNRNLFLNRQMSRLLGYTLEDYKQLKEKSLKQFIFHEDLAKVEKHILELSTLPESQTSEISFRLVRKDRKVISVHSKELIYNRDRNGAPVHILGIIRDVNDLMHNNSLPNFDLIVRTIGESLPSPIAVFDNSGQMVYQNEVFSNLDDLDISKWKGMQWLNLLSEEDRNLVLVKLKEEKGQLTEGTWRLKVNLVNHPDLVLNFSKIEVQGMTLAYLGTLERKLEIAELPNFSNEYKRFNTLMDNAGFSIFSVDKEFRYRSINKGHKGFLGKKFGIEPVEGDRMVLMERSTGEEKQLLESYLNRAFGGDSFTVIESLKFANNSTLELSFSPIVQVGKEIDEVVVVMKDISHSKSLEKLMKYYEGNFKEVFNNSPDAIYVEDYQGNILAVNPEACAMQNMEIDELLGKNILQITPKEFEKQVAEDFQRMVNGEIDILESYTWRKGDKPLAVEIKCSHIHYGEKPAMLLHVRNVSARKVAEQNVKNLHQVIEESGDLIAMISPDGKVIYSNKAFKERMGEMDTNTYFITAVNSEPDIQGLLTKAFRLAREEGSWIGEMEIIGKESVIIPCSQIVIAHKDERGNLMFFSTVLRDISTAKKTQDQLLKAKNLAEEAAKAKELFLANMSHEIRTPMNGIVGLTEVLLQSQLDESQFEMLKAIRTSGDNLLVILNDILDLAKITSGKMEFERVKFNLKELIQSVVKLHEGKAKAKSINIHFALDPRIPNEISGDSVKLSQILNNLIGNAVKFTDSGRVEITIEKGVEKPEGIQLNFIIKDTGIGIPEAKLPFVFDSFTQASSETTRKFGGTGLGLTITKQLIELQGGTIGVDSKEGRGSTFYFSLLFGIEKLDSFQVAGTKKVYQDEPQYDFKGARVLIAEDNSVNQLLMKRIMEKLNMVAELADNGEKALRLLEERDFDLVLMDMQMPEMDGYTATEQIRKGEVQVKAALPIIAITANSSIEDAKKCYKAGVNDYISKPFKQGELIEKLAKFLPFERL